MSTKENKKIILDFLQKENRPFSAGDIQTSLNGRLGKTAVVNTLDELSNEKKIIEKTYGKQKVYMTLQNVDITSIKTQLRELDEKIHIGKSDLNRTKKENDRLEAELQNFTNKMPIAELKVKLTELNEEINVLNNRLKNIKSANVPLITKEEKVKIQKEHEKYAKEWRKLKRIANEMIGTIQENCNMKKKQICEDLDLILDEDENVQPPSI